MTFQELYTRLAQEFHDTQHRRYGSATLGYYKALVNDGQTYIARFLSSDSLQKITGKIGIDPLDYIKALVEVEDGVFVVGGNELPLPSSFLSLLFYKINDYPVLIKDAKLMRQQKYNSFMEGAQDFYLGHRRGNYFRVYPDYNASDTWERGYVKNPAIMVADADTPDIDLALHPLICDWAVAKVYQKDGDDERSVRLVGQVERDLQILIGFPGQK